MLQQFAFCPKHIHVYDLIFTLGHKSLHVCACGCSKRTYTHTHNASMCVCQGGPAFVVYFQGCWFFLFIFLLLSWPPWQPIFWAVEKIAFERTLGGYVRPVGPAPIYLFFFVEKDCPLIYKFVKYKSKRIILTWLDENSANSPPQFVPQHKMGCGKWLENGRWRRCEGRGTRKPHKLPRTSISTQRRLATNATKAAFGRLPRSIETWPAVTEQSQEQ